MPKKGENIYKRKDGRWEGRIQQEDCNSGKGKRISVYGKTYSEVKRKMKLQNAPTSLGSGGNICAIDMAKQCDYWLENKKKQVKESTYQRYYAILEVHIKPWIKNNRQSCNGTDILVHFTDELSKKSLAAGTAKNILSIFNSIIYYMADNGVIDTLPIKSSVPKEQKKPARVLSAYEYEVLAKCLLKDITPIKLGILLSLECGLRIGEICAMKSGSISVTQRVLQVVSTIQRLPCHDENVGGKTRLQLTSPKSLSSIRNIPLTVALCKICKEVISKNDEHYLLTDKERPMEPRMLRYHLYKLCAECGLADVHFHTMRHTFATRCIDAGVEVKSLSEILGHSDTRITMDCYIHPSFESKRANLEKLKLTVY
ncbi:MAG: tyrosine-type recombinase/integrase [Oscillospiraceae bacterium]